MSKNSKIFDLSTLKSILLVLGAYIFSYCLGLTFHESGHAIALSIVGISDIKIYVHPFALSHCESGPITPEVMPFTGAMGPLFNVLCSFIVTLSVWHKRNPKLLPLLMCAGTAFMAEGVATFISLIELPLLTDWGILIIIGGAPPIIIGILGIIFIIIGSIFLLLLLPLENISNHHSFWKLISISLGFSLYFLTSVIYVSIFDPSVLFNRLIALISATGFTIMLMIIYKPVFPYLDRISHTETKTVNWLDVGIAIGAASIIIIIDLIFFY
ncbi:MAG: hypothetical protein ACFFA4_14445 [Promethearchaeota archaeon]